MVPFLLMISFILHIVMIATIAYLYKEIQPLKNSHHEEMIKMFDTYLEEIKAENKALQEQLNHSSNQVNPSPHKPKKKVNSAYDAFLPISETLNDEQMNDGYDSVDHKVDMETSFEAKVLRLYHEGHSEDDIAKQLNSGKTEVALIINLYGKKQHKS